MNIIIGNQKGGVGKTTHTILLSNYLTLEKHAELLVLDMDFQGSIKTRWEQDLELYENEPLYEVIQLELESFSAIFDQLNDTEGLVLIDLPGKMDDNNLVTVFEQANLVICPFMYDKLTFESTLVFAQVVKHVNREVAVIFLPNRLKAGVNYTIKQKVDETLSVYGQVVPAVSDRISLQRLDCLTMTEETKSIVRGPYEFIYELCLDQHSSIKKSTLKS